MFYEFRQNNSGGSFELDKKRGISTLVIVEADSKEDACRRAERIGIYFDGCESGIDCSCCGDRWSEPYDEKGTKVPCWYGTPLNKAKFGLVWQKPEVFIHYKSGRKKAYHPRKEQVKR